MEKSLVKSLSALLTAGLFVSAVFADIIGEPSIVESEGFVGILVAGVLAVTLAIYKFVFKKKRK